MLAWKLGKCFYHSLNISVLGKPFVTATPLNWATANIIASIVYGSRFEYNDPRFVAVVGRANESLRIAGSPSVQVNKKKTFNLNNEISTKGFLKKSHVGSTAL